jgi:hypothetical protein
MVTYNIKDNGDGTRNVKLVREPKSAERVIYASKPSGKPMNIGMNAAKRRANRLDRQDRARILQVLGAGLPKRDAHHSELVRSRHRCYHERHAEFARSQSDGKGKQE